MLRTAPQVGLKLRHPRATPDRDVPGTVTDGRRNSLCPPDNGGTARGYQRVFAAVTAQQSRMCQSDSQLSRIFIHRRVRGERPQLPLSGWSVAPQRGTRSRQVCGLESGWRGQGRVRSGCMTPDERWLAAAWPFVRGQLPAAPARVIELGCGPLGGFIPVLVSAGYDAARGSRGSSWAVVPPGGV